MEKVYRIPLRYFCGIIKKNLPVKIDFAITRNFETETKNFLN